VSKPVTICVLTDERIHALIVDARQRAPRVIDHTSVAHSVPDSILTHHDPAELASGIAAAVGASEAVRRAITLIVPLQWCFAQVWDHCGKARRQQLLFELEAFLPMPVEEVTCDTLRLDGDRVLGLGIATEPTAALMRALGERGIDVEHLLVDAMSLPQTGEAVAQAIVDKRWTRVAMRDGRTAVIATPAEPHAELIHQALRERAVLNGEPLEQLKMLDVTQPPSDAGGTGSPDQKSGTLAHDAVASLALAAAHSKRRIDLRTGALAGSASRLGITRLAHHCLMLLIICLTIATAGAHLHRRALHTHAAAIDQARLDTYRTVLAADELPAGAALRLASERIRLEVLTHSGADSETLRLSEGPLETLRQIVAELPEDVRIMLDEMRLDEQQVTLRGKTASHRDAERIAESMGNVPRLQVRPPRTTRLESGGVEFWIVAMRGAGNE